MKLNNVYLTRFSVQPSITELEVKLSYQNAYNDGHTDRHDRYIQPNFYIPNIHILQNLLCGLLFLLEGATGISKIIGPPPLTKNTSAAPDTYKYKIFNLFTVHEMCPLLLAKPTDLYSQAPLAQ